ncbi:MAG: NAD(P)-binding protein, partial [Betaproteobacteria bacterium]|nr:NAD(P)-binding protein [Betaproteobacteria bacterium]
MKRRTFVGAGASALLAGCDWDWLAARQGLQGGYVGANVTLGHRLRSGGFPPPSFEGQVDVAIVGAGVAGLAVARQLRRAGIDRYRLFDLEDEAGGNARGHVIAGMGCPLGAHYLPTPGAPAQDVRDLLVELGLLRVQAGRDVYDELTLCHSPQERLLIGSQWQEGLLPMINVDAQALRDYRRFATLVAQARATLPFAIPTVLAGWAPGLDALDGQSFAQWLAAQGLDSTAMRWYLNYCCRDDYGAPLGQVSAWAGLHYFASRHGFRAPGTDGPDDRDELLTWPEGNAWLTRHLAAAHAAQLQTASLTTRVQPTARGVQIDVWNDALGRSERWTADQVVLCTPLFISARLLAADAPAALTATAARIRYAPWLVANVWVPEPLDERPGAPRAWDNVMMGDSPQGLGYVDAMHQSTRPTPASIGPTVLTYYMSFGTAPAAREAL